MHMAEVYSKKLTCLSAVVKQREDWQQVILGNNRTAALQEILDKTKDAAKDESTLVDSGDIEDEEE